MDQVDAIADAGALEALLLKRLDGPFEPFEPDWMERVRSETAKRTGGEDRSSPTGIIGEPSGY